MYDVTLWLTNNYNTHIIQYLKGNQAMTFGQLIEYNQNITMREPARAFAATT